MLVIPWSFTFVSWGIFLAPVSLSLGLSDASVGETDTPFSAVWIESQETWLLLPKV